MIDRKTGERVVATGWCMFCDPFGEDTPAYLDKSQHTVRYLESGIGYCQSCGWRDDQSEAAAQRKAYDA